MLWQMSEFLSFFKVNNVPCYLSSPFVVNTFPTPPASVSAIRPFPKRHFKWNPTVCSLPFESGFSHLTKGM